MPGHLPPGPEQARKAFRVFARRQPDSTDPDGYAVPHTAITYLITPDGQYADHFPDALPDPDLATRLRAHLGKELSGRVAW
ncbi:MAG TPA: hypothetical protein VFW50_31550 [Streptosporangiaceae bacterium]|nr:hypothetical protein [Streptosporangiaceae bacterium]